MWMAEDRDRERTLAVLEERGIVFVCVDAPEVSGLPRLLGRRGWVVLIAHRKHEGALWSAACLPPFVASRCSAQV